MNETATLAGGCFWCTEAVYKRLKGVVKVVPGYSGGTTQNPTYGKVCSGTTGHAESIQITYDPKEISFEKILEVFWKLHDPTTRNRQGNDIGTQYRSEIFYHNDRQNKIAEKLKDKLEKNKIFKDPIVTKITPYSNFYPAEDYHKNYYENNKEQAYCRLVIDPKLSKLYKEFPKIIN